VSGHETSQLLDRSLHFGGNGCETGPPLRSIPIAPTRCRAVAGCIINRLRTAREVGRSDLTEFAADFIELRLALPPATRLYIAEAPDFSSGM